MIIMKQGYDYNKDNRSLLKLNIISFPVFSLLLTSLFKRNESLENNIFKSLFLYHRKTDILNHFENILFFTALSIFFFQNTLGVSVLNLVGDWWKLTLFLKKTCLYVAGIKVVIDIAKGRHSIRAILMISTISALQYIVYIKTGNMAMIILWIFILASKNIDFNKIIKYSFIINVYLMIFVVSSSLLGIVEERIYLRADGTYRYSLGYQYTTNIANLYMHMIFMYVYWKKKKISIVSMILLMLVNILLFRLTDTKNAFIMGSMALIGAFILKASPHFRSPQKWINVIFLCCIPIFAVVSIGLTYFYNKDILWMNSLDRILSGRLRLGYMGIEQYGISLFGNKIEWVGGGYIYEVSKKIYNYVDSSYVQFLLEFGSLALILTCIYFIALNYKAIKKKDIWFGIVIFVIAIHSIPDPQLMWLECNPFLLYGLSKTYESPCEIENVISWNWRRRCLKNCLIIGVFITALYYGYKVSSIIRTWMTMYQFYEVERQKYFILFYIILAGLITCIGINITKAKTRNRLIAACGILTIGISFCLMLTMIKEKQKDYKQDIERGINLVKALKAQGNSLDAIYVEDIPYCYEKELKNFSVIMGKLPKQDDNAIVFAKKGNFNQYLYDHQYYGSLISEREYVFVKGNELKRALEQQGFDLKSYYDGLESINIKRLAEINKLPIINLENGKSAIKLNGNKQSLIYGPYFTIYRGKLEVTYDLTLLDTDIQSGEVAKARISSDYGKNIMNMRIINKEDFNDENEMTVSMIQDIEDSNNMEFLLFADGNTKIAVSSITYQTIDE